MTQDISFVPPIDFEISPELQHMIEELNRRIEAINASMPKFDSELMDYLSEVDHFEKDMARLGLAAHPFLFEVLSQSNSAMSELEAPSIASEMWPSIRDKLLLIASRFGDERSKVLLREMILAHDAALYELVPVAAASLMERVARLARRENGPRKPIEWLRDLGGELAPAEIGGMPGVRVWQILIKHTFAQCWEDRTADSIPYLNRHALAHGFGSRLATEVDSFNAVLLAHFVLWIAIAARADDGDT